MSETTITERTESAWERCRHWFPVHDSRSVREVVLLEVRSDRFFSLLRTIENNTEVFDIKPTWVEDALADRIDALKLESYWNEKHLNNFVVAYDPTSSGFHIPTRLLVDRHESGFLDLGFTFVPEDVFPADINPKRRFEQLMKHIFSLQHTFFRSLHNSRSQA